MLRSAKEAVANEGKPYMEIPTNGRPVSGQRRPFTVARRPLSGHRPIPVRSGSAASLSYASDSPRSRKSGGSSVGSRMKSWQTAVNDRIGGIPFHGATVSPLTVGLLLRPGSRIFHRMDKRAGSPFDAAYEYKSKQPKGIDFFRDWSLPTVIKIAPEPSGVHPDFENTADMSTDRGICAQQETLDEGAERQSAAEKLVKRESINKPRKSILETAEPRQSLARSRSSHFEVDNSDVQAEVLDAVPPVLLPKQQIEDAFRVLARGQGEISSDIEAICEVFRKGGFAYGIRKDWLREVVEVSINGCSTIDLHDFLTLVQAYEKRLQDLFEEAFQEASTEKGAATVAMLPTMLKRVGVVPMPGAIPQMVARIAGRDGVAADCEISYGFFVTVYGEFNRRAGLQPDEFDRLMTGFKKLVNDDGECEKHELEQVCRWHPLLVALVGEDHIQRQIQKALHRDSAYAMGLDPEFGEAALTTKALSQQVDTTVSEQVFLLIARMFHEDVAGKIRAMMTFISGSDDSIPIAQVPRLFSELGAVSPSLADVIQECSFTCGFHEKDVLSMDDVYTLLLHFCLTEGMTKAEKEELKNLFVTLTEKLADSESRPGAFNRNEISRALRWQAYIPSEYRLYDFVEGNDHLNVLEFLDLNQFIEVISAYRYNSVGSVFWKKFAQTDHLSRSLPFTHLEELFALAGQDASESHLEQLLQIAEEKHMKRMFWEDFLKLEKEYRVLLVKTLAGNQGFTNQEVDRFRAEFEKRDFKKTGAVTIDQLTKMIKEVLPAIPIDAEFRTLVASVNTKRKAKFAFDEVLWFMRRLSDRDERKKRQKSAEVRAKLGFNREEVAQLRELFNMTDTDRSGEVDFGELQAILSSLVSIVGDVTRELAGFIKEVDTNKNGALDFWEFLALMRKLQDVNWRNINGIAEGTSKNNIMRSSVSDTRFCS